MASTASEDTLIKVSTEGAQDFVEAYYTALQNSRTTIATYYTPTETIGEKTVPDILYNGNTIETALDFQKMYQDSMPPMVHIDVHAIDAQIMNPRYAADTTLKPEKNISILVMTAGHMRLESKTNGPLMEFSETFLLVPNLEKSSGKGVMAGRRSWLIQTQNFRYTVVHDPIATEGQVAMDIA